MYDVDFDPKSTSAVGKNTMQNISQMSYSELLEQREKIERAIQERAEREKNEALLQVAEIVVKFSLGKKDLLQALSLAEEKRKPRPAPKYKNPETGETWSGRGKAPAWIAEAKDKSIYAIKAEPQS